MNSRSRFLGLALILGIGSACSTAATPAAISSSGQPSAGSGTRTGTTAVSGTLKIVAASSLKGAFEVLTTRFEAVNPGVKIADISYDGSSVLATQLIAGAPADIFASADEKNMAKVSDAHLLAGPSVDFATNTLQIAVAPGNPKAIRGLKDLPGAGLSVVLCAPAVPCGAAARTALAAAGVKVLPASEEQNVTAVLTKVESGDADVGLVYRTDVLAAAGKVAGVDFPESVKAVNHYPVGVLAGSADAAPARAFAAFLTSPAGREVLAAKGFGAP